MTIMMISTLQTLRDLPIDGNEYVWAEINKLSKMRLIEIKGRQKAKSIRIYLPSCYTPPEVSIFQSIKFEFYFDKEAEGVWEYDHIHDRTYRALAPLVRNFPYVSFSLGFVTETIFNTLEIVETWDCDQNISMVVASFAESYVKVEIFEEKTIYSASGESKSFVIENVKDTSMDLVKKQVLDSFSILTIINVKNMLDQSVELCYDNEMYSEEFNDTTYR